MPRWRNAVNAWPPSHQVNPQVNPRATRRQTQIRPKQYSKQKVIARTCLSSNSFPTTKYNVHICKRCINMPGGDRITLCRAAPNSGYIPYQGVDAMHSSRKEKETLLPSTRRKRSATTDFGCIHYVIFLYLLIPFTTSTTPFIPLKKFCDSIFKNKNQPDSSK